MLIGPLADFSVEDSRDKKGKDDKGKGNIQIKNYLLKTNIFFYTFTASPDILRGKKKETMLTQKGEKGGARS